MAVPKSQYLKTFCYKNGINCNVWFHKKDTSFRTIELNADLKRGKSKLEFFMSFDPDWNLSRFEIKYNKIVKRFYSLEDCLNWVKGATYLKQELKNV